MTVAESGGRADEKEQLLKADLIENSVSETSKEAFDNEERDTAD